MYRALQNKNLSNNYTYLKKQYLFSQYVCQLLVCTEFLSHFAPKASI